MTCYVCNIEINSSNKTDEHIIINAAGGRLKSKKLVCVKCNSNFGDKIDSELAKQLNLLSNFLMVKRHTGEAQPVIGTKASGKKYLLTLGGDAKLHKPQIKKTIEEDKVQLSISARSEKELKKILTGFTKKHPDINVKESMNLAKWHSERFEEFLTLDAEVGGVEVFRAVCKCAINFYIYSKGHRTEIKHLLAYIQQKEDKEVVWMHYQDDLYTLQSHESFHLLHLVGNSEEKILYCYVDYFNTYKYLVLLNDSYNGHNLSETYCFDIINIKPIQKEVNICYNRKTLLDFFKNKDTNFFKKVENAFKHSITLGRERQRNFQIDRLIEKASEKSFIKYPEGTLITKEMINENIIELIEEIIPYLHKRKL
jgi:HNH endonuclease